METFQPDWARLQKALSVEAERGFVNLQGHQYRFYEFLQVSLGEILGIVPIESQHRCRELTQQFSRYPDMNLYERQNLVTDSHRFLLQIQRFSDYKLRVEESRRLGIEPSQSRSTDASSTESSPTGSRSQISRAPTVAVRSTADSTWNQQPANLRQDSSPTLKAEEQPAKNLTLEAPLKGIVGPRNGDRLARLGLYTVYDLLYYYPRNHVDYGHHARIRDLEPGETVTIMARVKRCSCFSSPRNKKLTILELMLVDDTGQLKLSRFYAGSRYATPAWQNVQRRNYPTGAIVAASGLVKRNKYGITLENPELEVLNHTGGQIESMKVGRVVPVYPLTEGLGADIVRKAVTAVLPTVKQLPEPLPLELRQTHELIDLQTAIQNIHFPENPELLTQARQRLVFDEFFYLQLWLLQRRQQQKVVETSVVLSPTGKLIDQFYQILPFELTNAQGRVVQEILQDLNSSEPMNRLVQGDVGAGKTVVAVVAMLAAIQAGYQTALMAPTEVLAEQHYRKFVSWFNLLHLPVELLTGSTKVAKRRQIHAQLETGELSVLVGTHALIQDAVNFSRLGLVVIDEQHRFGVEQRAKLQQKGESPHVLTMTATPIPRTLALTLHGDLDVSQLDELPPGRQPIQTTVLTGQQRQQAYDLIRREIVQGRQVYIVLPLVEESEKLDVRSAVEEHEKLQGKVFPEFQVGLLHGRMTSADKDQAISQFRDQQTHILVSTTVVEVGVDVPNATVMLIENAERFGLSQLHQLRGRVGRGEHKSYCLLMTGSKTPEARQRLNVLEQSQDGFFIAEMDLQLRGPGQVLGTRQSGLPDFVLASLVEDQGILEVARTAAQQLLDQDPSLGRWPTLQVEWERRYQRMMGGSILT
ncbi:MAG: ATP-dependent DNA helicase RecG [Oscillatoriales cyanobacterium RM2_1_1]|nr:ATP-dependent DNA helicase RecG [Oscillatoriales cyanobacterium SM2_3_0]NJO44831.1 ATP-dependent DNA helicase RecG [Oscillatoriales cyanobacterium RM2_1_1]